MQTLRKKNSPCKFKNEPTRFLGEGVSFKAKLIGILEVSEARGDRMCQRALADLKMAIRAAGEHKQRIAVQISIDGLRLRDEKTGECLYHHPVHKISFICQDMSDTRAFGYIFGSPDTGHRFFGIKTDKAASQVVIAVRELFQVVLELKKKEIELAKQQIEHNAINAIKFHTSGIFVEPAPDTKGAAGTESSLHRMRTTNSEVEKPAERKDESQSGVIADLLDLQFELNSLQQGIHQMDKITPENPAPSSEDLFDSDPFGDSFANMKLKETVQPILPPPPSSSKRSHLERQSTLPGAQTSASSSPATIPSKTPPPQGSMNWFDKDSETLFSDNEASSLTKTPTKKDPDEVSLRTTLEETNRQHRNTEVSSVLGLLLQALAKSPQVDVFTELDPLGTGLIKPYVDKKDFFQHLKNPPKKVLRDLVSTNASDTFPTDFHSDAEPLDRDPDESVTNQRDSDQFEDNDFANFDRFDEKDTLQQSLTRSESPRRRDSKSSLLRQLLSSTAGSVPPEEPVTPKTSGTVTQATSTSPANVPTYNRVDKEPVEPVDPLLKLPNSKKYVREILMRKKKFDFDTGSRGQSIDKSFPVDFTATGDSPVSPLRSCSSDANSRLSTSSAELELVPEPPPRGAGSILINPPPLPPKKQNVRGGMKPPPRPPHTDAHFHYDFPERSRASPSPTRTPERPKSPMKDTPSQFDDNFSPTLQSTPRTSDIIGSMTTTAFEDSFHSMMPTTNLSSYFATSSATKTKPSLDITLSQLTSSNLDELANSLGMTVQELTSLTLQQLTECLASLSTKEIPTNDIEQMQSRQETTPVSKLKVQSQEQSLSSTESCHFVNSELFFKPNFDQELKQDSTYDKYAVFRELLELEQMEEHAQSVGVGFDDKNDEEAIAEEVRVSEKLKRQLELHDISVSDSLASLANAIVVRLPPTDELKEDFLPNVPEVNDISVSLKCELEQSVEFDETEQEFISDLQIIADALAKQTTELKIDEASQAEQSVEELMDDSKTLQDQAEVASKDSDASESPEKGSTDSNIAIPIHTSVPEKPETKIQTAATDRYAALRDIIIEPKPILKMDDEPPSPPARDSPVTQLPAPRNVPEVELLNLFSDPIPSPSSPKKQPKKEEDLKAVAMDIFEEIKMLNTSIQQRLPDKDPKPLSTGFEDVFCPFTEAKSEKEEIKDDANWAKFDTGVFGSDRSSGGEGPRSIGGTSPWSPDGKEFHRETSFKGSMHRHSGDSDNEWKDEEESEESNGRMRGDARFWCRHPRFNPPAFEDRSFYEEPPGTPGDKRERERSFRDRMGRKSRGVPWTKTPGHRAPRDPSPWHEEGQWEEDPWHNQHCKMPYKDEEDPYWKCRPKSQRWKRGPEHPAFYDEERKRRLMLWSEEDRFGSQESMCYEDEENWPRRKYDRRRWEEDPRYGRRMAPPHEGDYPMRESYYYYRESRERPHGYPPAWDQEYGPERPADESPRYNPAARKRHWPKRPNSANDGRNSEVVYTEPRSKFGSRSECSDNDSDPYLRPSQRSRSRESYWGSDQEYDSWVERPYWSEGPEGNSESLHRKRIPRRKGGRQPPTKTQSPFDDDFAQTGEQAESPATETLAPIEPRVRSDVNEGKREPTPASPSTSGRSVQKEHFVAFEYDLTPTASASSDTSDRQRATSDLKATPEELPCDTKDTQQTIDAFASEDNNRDSFFNGDLRYEDDAFAFKADLEDNDSEHRNTLPPLKNTRQNKYGPGNNNNSKARGDQYIRKSESVNIFVRESDPFDDDDFFN